MEEMHENRVREYFAYRLLLPLPVHTVRDFLKTGKKKRAVPVIGDQPFLFILSAIICGRAKIRLKIASRTEPFQSAVWLLP